MLVSRQSSARVSCESIKLTNLPLSNRRSTGIHSSNGEHSWTCSSRRSVRSCRSPSSRINPAFSLSRFSTPFFNMLLPRSLRYSVLLLLFTIYSIMLYHPLLTPSPKISAVLRVLLFLPFPFSLSFFLLISLLTNETDSTMLIPPPQDLYPLAIESLTTQLLKRASDLTNSTVSDELDHFELSHAQWIKVYYIQATVILYLLGWNLWIARSLLFPLSAYLLSVHLPQLSS